MNTQTATFFSFSELEENTDIFGQNGLINVSDFDVSFGDAKHTLITKQKFIEECENWDLDSEDHDGAVEKSMIDGFRKLMDELPDDILIDLES